MQMRGGWFRRVIVIFFICIMLCSCAVLAGDISDVSQQPDAVSDSAAAISGSAVKESNIASNSAIAVSGGAVKKRKASSVIVIDETGQERELDLGEININKVVMDFPVMIYPTCYSQVVGNDYYFLRADGRGNYTIYRNKCVRVGQFSLKQGIVSDFMLYKGKFYALVVKNYDVSKGEKLVEIDLQKQATTDICYIEGDMLLGLYKGGYYYENEDGNEVCLYDIEKEKVIRTLTADAPSCPNALVYGLYVDDNVFYGVVSDKKVTLYSFDLANCVEEEVLQFECADKKMLKEYKYIYDLEIDEDYICCLDYLIPRKGGKFVRLPRDSEIDTVMTSFVQNKKYFFYIDKDREIHRIDKRSFDDIVINKDIWAMDIQCTENGLYVQEYEESEVSLDWHFDEEDDCEIDEATTTELADSCDLYYMDFNGENVKRIWKGQ